MLKAQLKDLEMTNKKINDDISSLKKRLEAKSSELKNAEKEIKDLKNINDSLIEAVKVLNQKSTAMFHIILSLKMYSLEKTSLFQKQSLKATQIEYNNDQVESRDMACNGHKEDDLINLNEELNTFRCPECNYETDSKRGLKVHVGMKHKKHI